MGIAYMYIFDKNGSLLFYHEWDRKKHTGMSREEEAKLMYGMVYSLKSFVWKVSPVDLKEGYYCYASDKYRLHFYESPTKLKMILTTDLTAQGIKELLHQIYTQIYVEYVVMNPLCILDKPIESELFSSKLDEMIKQHPSFQSRYS
ncbi:UNVERIFIED_CONTAM: hypothetical protein RMT77_002630 [Armadillidium vulgare]